MCIATTRGPVAVRAFYPDPGANQSAMVLYEQDHIATGVDHHYHRFSRSVARILAQAFGLESPADPVILEVDGDVAAGSSWQLGAFIVQALAAADRLAPDPAEAEHVLWTTGEIGTNSRSVHPVEDVARKLAVSRPLFERLLAEGKRVTALLPAGNADAIPGGGVPDGVEVRPVASLFEVMALLGVRFEEPASATAPGEAASSAGAAVDDARRGRRLARLGGAVAAVLVAGVGLAAFLTDRLPRSTGGIAEEGAVQEAAVQEVGLRPAEPASAAAQAPEAAGDPVPGEEPPRAPVAEEPPASPIEPVRPELRALEQWAPDGSTCVAVQWEESRVEPELRPIAAPSDGGSSLQSVMAERLCGIVWRVEPPPEGRVFAALFVRVEEGGYRDLSPRRGELSGAVPLTGARERRLELPKRLHAPLAYRVFLVSGAEPVPAGAAALETDPAPERVLRELEGAGFAVEGHRHSVVPSSGPR